MADDMQGHCENCLKGAIGADAKLDDFAGVKAFIARPLIKSTSALVVATDIYGPQLKQNQENACNIANKAGILVVVPDLFNGDHIPFEGFDRSKFPEWLAKHPFQSGYPIIEGVIKELVEKEGIKKIGIIGYCYGAKAAIHFANNNNKVNCYGIAHPTRLDVTEIESLNISGLWICAEHDESFPKQKRQETEEILKKKNGIVSLFVDYPNTSHGFAARPKTPEEEKARLEAVDETAKFFKAHL